MVRVWPGTSDVPGAVVDYDPYRNLFPRCEACVGCAEWFGEHDRHADP